MSNKYEIGDKAFCYLSRAIREVVIDYIIMKKGEIAYCFHCPSLKDEGFHTTEAALYDTKKDAIKILKQAIDEAEKETTPKI